MFSVGLLAITMAGLLQTHWLGESIIDPAARSLLGHNFSDLLRSLYFVAAVVLIGLPSLRVIMTHWPGEEVPDYRRWWLSLCATAAVALVITSRIGDARTIPVEDELQLGDLSSGVYSAIGYALSLALCVALTTASTITIRRIGWRPIPTLTGAVGTIGAASSIATLGLLATNRSWLMANSQLVTGWALPLSVLLVGAGAWAAIHQGRA